MASLGFAAIAAIGAAGVQAATTAPSALGFGGQSMGTTAPAQAVTFTNDGATSITVSAVAVSDPQFAQTNNCNTLASGASCTINVTITPTPTGGALLSTTSVSGNLTITSNGVGSPNVVSLTGTGEKSLVTHYYRSILRRAPDGGGKAFWESEATRMAGLAANVNETWFAMATFFYFSGEYTAFGRNDTEFVTDLYNTFFNRGPDAGGLAFWTGQIAAGVPREIVLVSFMFSNEFVTFTQGIFGNTAARKEVDTVVDFYRGALSRLPDTGGFNFWVQQFRTAQCSGAAAVNAQVESISSSFFNSSEYTGRNRSNPQFVGDLYNAFLRRGGDQGGVLFWIGQLNGGATRNSIRQQFIASPEFQGRVAAVIAQGCITPPLTCTDPIVLCVGGPQSEYATIQAAITAANPAAGKTVLVFDGNYAGFQVPSNRSGTAQAPFTVKAQSGNANITSAASGSDGDGIWISNANNVVVDGFRIDNMPGHGIGCHNATSASPMIGVTIRNNTVTNSGISNIYCSNAAQSLIEYNVATGAKAEHGIYLANGGADNTTIRGNVLSGNFRNGLHLNGDISVGGDGLHTGIVIEGNTIFGNTDNAMDLDGVYDSTIRNNLIYGNGHHGIRVFQIDASAGAGNLRIVNNTIVIPNPSNGGAPIKLTQDVGGHTIFNNILINLGTSGTIVTGNTNFKSDFNVVVNSGFSINGGSTLLNFTQWKALAGGYDANSVVSDVNALFVSPGTNDFRLKSGSPAANTGVGTFNGITAPATDIVNVPRPQGAAVDRGAYESF